MSFATLICRAAAAEPKFVEENNLAFVFFCQSHSEGFLVAKWNQLGCGLGCCCEVQRLEMMVSKLGFILATLSMLRHNTWHPLPKGEVDFVSQLEKFPSVLGWLPNGNHIVEPFWWTGSREWRVSQARTHYPCRPRPRWPTTNQVAPPNHTQLPSSLVNGPSDQHSDLMIQSPSKAPCGNT